jgi:hypothetical protein
MFIKELWIKAVEFSGSDCAICGQRLDHTMAVKGGKKPSEEPIKPKPGDLTVCAHCLGVNAFLPDLSLRIATSQECERLPDWVRELLASTERGEQ